MKNKILYRVQGANLGYPSIILADFYKIRSPKTHLFVSKNIAHHEYYINKRVKQFIKNLLVVDGKMNITEDIVKYVSESLMERDVEPLSLIEFEALDIMLQLLEENSLEPGQIHRKKSLMPKKVDVERFEGGFHLTQLWLKIFCDSLICLKYCNVGPIDILQFIKPLIGENIYSFGQIDYAPIRLQTHKFIAKNPVFSNDFWLEVILRDLRAILREGAFVEGTSLDEDSEQVIDNFMRCIETAKTDALRLTRER